MTATRKTDAKSTRKPTSSGTGAARSRATKTAAKASAAKTGTKAASKQKPAAPATPAPLTSDPLFPPLPSAVLQTPRAREHFSRLTQPTPPSVPAAHEQPVVTDHADQLLTGQDAEPTTAEPSTPAAEPATTTSRGRSRRRAAATPAADAASDDAPSSAAARRSSRGRSRSKSSARPKSGSQTKSSARPTADVTTSGRGTPIDVSAPTPEQAPPTPTLTSDVPATRTERPVSTDMPSTDVPSTDAASATDANTPGLSGTAAVARLDTFTQRLQALIRTFTPFHICQGGRVGGLAPEEVAEQVTRDHNRILDLFTQRDATEAALLAAMSGPSGEQGTKAALLSALRARGAVTRHDLYRHVAQQKTLHLDQLKKATETAERRIDQAINIPGESFEHLMKVLMPTSFDPLSYATRIDDLITEAMQDEQATDSAFDLYLASLTLILP